MMRSVALFLVLTSQIHAEAVKVALAEGGGLLRDGKPYFIKGAGGLQHLDEVVKRGGNSVRTWGERDLDPALEEASKRGLTVCAGIWLEPECSWFSYRNEEHCAKQLARVRKLVVEHRDHPALLLWGLGNEAEGDGRNEAYWKQLNALAKMVHKEDPAHLTFTAVAGLGAEKAKGMNAFAPDLDMVGINTYGALFGLREHLVKVGWTRPWVVTEFGAQGFWECPKTSWDAPLEATSTQKAAVIRGGYEKAIAPAGKCLGSYVFIWGQKQEATATWFGLFTAEGESVPAVDVMQEVWTEKAPENRAPELKGLRGISKNATMQPGQVFTAEVEATDPEGDELKVRWQVCDDLKKRGAEGREMPPRAIEGSVKASGMGAEIKSPDKPGIYRVFVFVSDGKGHAATASAPFRVESP
jgi:Glycosyl hydrolases family 2, TIM barrel domain